jgi:putative Flp pilus-assembly TadE/G-like protein
MPDQRDLSGRPLSLDPRGRGQALVLFALFLLVLLGSSALAVDYANWLLTDRKLQNVTDHAALAGASVFDQSSLQTDCGSNPAICGSARAQAWESLNQDLALGLDGAAVACLAQRDTPAGGYKEPGDSPDGCSGTPFRGRTLWVTTPPPDNASYTGVGGRYALNHAVVFARVDEPTRSYLASVFGIGARDRIGWATAGPLPTDFALEVFCRNGVAPQSGACGGSGATALVIDGQGGIRLIRGDIGSNESLKVTATNGGGVVLDSGRMFLVNGTCSNALWRCPNGPPSLGGISDGYNGQNAFYMPPQPIPHYGSPLADVGVQWSDCQGASVNSFCVPAYRPVGAARSQQPGDWTCEDPIDNPTSANPCGEAVVVGSEVSCRAYVPLTFTPSRDLVPYKDGAGANFINGVTVNNNNQKWQNVDDNPAVPDPDTTNPPANPPSDYVYLQNNLNAGSNRSFTFALRPPFGIPDVGQPTTINYTAFKTNGGTLDSTGNEVDVSVTLYQQGTPIWGPMPAGTPLTATPQQFTTSVPSGTITNYNALSLQFTFSSPAGGGGGASRRAGGISWAEAQTPPLSEALPPMLWPGYYHSITVPPEHPGLAKWCALLDPTAIYRAPGAGSDLPGLQLYQKPGIYRFGPDASSTIDIGNGSFLIGDGVTFVFDPGFPNPSSNGLKINPGAALVLNTMRVPGTPPCTPAETETTTYNPSSIDPSNAALPLKLLPYSSVCAAWTVDTASNASVHPGLMAWPIPETELAGTNQCGDPLLAQPVLRACYESNPTPGTYRGITFYFSTANWPATTVRGRFQMSAGGGMCDGSQPGIAFRGVLYAPYDDVVITAGSSFGAVGQILAWTVKFNGACPNLVLDYPYQSEPAPPYLLEPGLGQ